jgi:uncharacterized protein (TIGR00369 family)
MAFQGARTDWPFEEVYTPAREAFQRELFDGHPLVGVLKCRLVDCAKGYVRIDLPWQYELSNYGAGMHGGIVAAMVDSVAGQAVLTVLRPAHHLATVHMDTRYLRPFREGSMRCEGTVIKWGRLCHVAATLSAGDKKVATGSAIIAIVDAGAAGTWTAPG